MIKALLSLSVLLSTENWRMKGNLSSDDERNSSTQTYHTLKEQDSQVYSADVIDPVKELEGIHSAS
jgi:hypothetical protein